MNNSNSKVRAFMSTTVVSLGRNDKLSIADDLMQQKRIRHLPVLDDDAKVCGIVSQRDLFRGALLRALGYGSRAEDLLLDSLLVKEAMTEQVYTTSAETPIVEAARQMLEHKVGCLPVTEQGKLVGLLSESDILRLFADA